VTATSGWRLGLAGLIVACGGPAAAQIPDKFTNLQVLPKDIARGDLVETMRGFATALGVRCEHCHVGEGGPSLPNMDFASDQKEAKRIARFMMQMARAINDDHLARLAGERHLRVRCMTCHRGVTEPATIDAIVSEELEKKGVESAVARYRELRQRYYGRSSYDFGEPPLNALGEALLRDKRNREALAILELNAEFHPGAAWTRHLIGEAHLASGEREKAKASFTKALDINPELGPARKRLEQLKTPAP
jgi:tetratricopeptide (TPR) repeat protein